MKSALLLRLHGLPLGALLLLGQALASGAAAQPAPERTVAAVEIASQPAAVDRGGAEAGPASAPAQPAAKPRRVRSIDIGGATEGLLALQRSAVSAHPRNIDGEQAGRSYQRYLKSFETSIPEQYNTGLDLLKQ